MEEGRQLGRYELITRLATGGMAEVWLARARGIKGFRKTIVLKTILPHFADNPDFVRMFINEALLAAVLNHPNIVQIFDLGQIGDRYFIAMEFVDGRTMRQVQRALAKARKITPPWLVLHVAMAACEALEHAHNKCGDDGEALNIVHRDVTPENIMISFAGTTKVLDFGIAKASIAASETKAGTLKGKYAYMAPERIMGMKEGEKPDGRSDVYSMGIVLYEMLTGVRPFKANNELLLLKQITEDDPKPPRTIARWVPARLDQIVTKAMVKDPALRYQSAAELREELHEFLISVDSHPTERHVSEFLCKLFKVDKKGGVSLPKKPTKAVRTPVQQQPPPTPASEQAKDQGSDSGESSGPGYYYQMMVEGKSFITGAGGVSDEALVTRETEEISTSELLAAAEAEAATVLTDSGLDSLMGRSAGSTSQTNKPVEPPPLPPEDTDELDSAAGQPSEPAAGQVSVDSFPPMPLSQLPGATGPQPLSSGGSGGELMLGQGSVELPAIPSPSTTGELPLGSGPGVADTQESGVDPVPAPEPAPAPAPEPEPEPEPPPDDGLAIMPRDSGEDAFGGLDLQGTADQPVVDIESATSGATRAPEDPAEPAQAEPEAAPEPEEQPTGLDIRKGARRRKKKQATGPLTPGEDHAQTTAPEDQPSSIWDRPKTMNTDWDRLVARTRLRPTSDKAPPPGEEPDEPAVDPEDQPSIWDTLVTRARKEAKASTREAQQEVKQAAQRQREQERQARREESSTGPAPTEAESRARAKFELGLSLVRERDFPGARVAWEEALKLDPDNRVYKGNIRRLKKLMAKQQRS